MACSACSRQTLQTFIRAVTGFNQFALPRTPFASHPSTTRQLSTSFRYRSDEPTKISIPTAIASSAPSPDNPSATKLPPSNKPKKPRKKTGTPDMIHPDESIGPKPPTPLFKPDKPEKEQWQIQKEALHRKFGSGGWAPRKKLSPDAMEGIRHLHKSQPDKFTTPVLAEHFKVSAEAIRRILKSKWRPSDEEQEERLRRWDKRGERIWGNLVELGVKPPKRWREMGVGRVKEGEGVPKWKGRWRNRADVGDSVRDEVIPLDAGPVVGEEEWPRRQVVAPISERLL